MDGDASRIDFPNPNPFYSTEEVNPPASCGYRYRKFDLSINEEEDMDMIVRTEVDSFIRGAPSATSAVSTSDYNKPDGSENTYITIKTLFEFDTRAIGAGGAPDWRTKLDTQKGAVVATEMKNNSCKLARFAVQSILAGAEQMKMGYARNVQKNFAGPRQLTIMPLGFFILLSIIMTLATSRVQVLKMTIDT